ncbi:hypothetical protein ACFFOS_02925 [Nocardioides kongjuensis]|uniref:Uncharacterized protein n=1 Tax=Nocardioides kongjuensis TaxID=349522 RepID=A0A852R741_9ACTN|nr:hypothetical protein [Nocardioides kongjuensis]NYD28727.1 hypothetical protein [Nocardioides kongjuensis]
MILVLASERDPGAAALVAGWAGARLLTPADLSLPGWELAAGPSSGTGPSVGRGIADGEPFTDDGVRCVVSLLAGVEAGDLAWIAEEHRTYVAGEMTAFLGHWLETIGERCLVAPSHASLAGPCLPTSVWAASAGLAMTDDEEPVTPVVVTVVGGEVFRVAGEGPAPSAELRRRLVRMAITRAAPLLTVVVDLGGGRALPRLHAVLPAPLARTAPVRAAIRTQVRRVVGTEVAS